MLYSTLEQLKATLDIKAADGDPADDLLLMAIDYGSRLLDLMVAGPNGQDFFAETSFTDAILSGILAADSSLQAWPRLYPITAVTAMAWRYNPLGEWQPLTSFEVVDKKKLVGWGAIGEVGRVSVRASFAGGGADITDLPPGVNEVANLLSARIYREYGTQLTDAMGIAELGTLVYTSALPARAVNTIKFYKSPVARG